MVRHMHSKHLSLGQRAEGEGSWTEHSPAKAEEPSRPAPPQELCGGQSPGSLPSHRHGVITELAALWPMVLRHFHTPVGDSEMHRTNRRTRCRAL